MQIVAVTIHQRNWNDAHPVNTNIRQNSLTWELTVKKPHRHNNTHCLPPLAPVSHPCKVTARFGRPCLVDSWMAINCKLNVIQAFRHRSAVKDGKINIFTQCSVDRCFRNPGLTWWSDSSKWNWYASLWWTETSFQLVSETDQMEEFIIPVLVMKDCHLSPSHHKFQWYWTHSSSDWRYKTLQYCEKSFPKSKEE